MLRALIRGVGMGAGIGIGQEIVGAIIDRVQHGRHDIYESTRDIRCSGCGEFNTEDSRFCGQCGNTLIERCHLSQGVTCSCGFVNAKGQKYCSECGTMVINQ